jgi:hypothetical protein
MDTQEQPTEEAVDRRDLLAQQFSEAEISPESPEPVESQVADGARRTQSLGQASVELEERLSRHLGYR